MRRILLILLACVALVPASSAQALTLDGFRSTTIEEAEPPRVIGRLIIPRLNVNSKILDGITDRDFDLGVGRWPGSPGAGQAGNLVIGGHRTAGPRPFYNIQDLRRGDIITVVEGETRARYAVEKHMIVGPKALWITNQSSESILTLFTCHPRGSTKQRYIIFATLIE